MNTCKSCKFYEETETDKTGMHIGECHRNAPTAMLRVERKIYWAVYFMTWWTIFNAEGNSRANERLEEFGLDPEDNQLDEEAIWPIVRPWDYCGEFQERAA